MLLNSRECLPLGARGEVKNVPLAIARLILRCQIVLFPQMVGKALNSDTTFKLNEEFSLIHPILNEPIKVRHSLRFFSSLF
jgi:hypothetical protein